MKTLITRIKRLALALCLATPFVSWAVEMTNPVTGATESYVNTFTGKNTSEWNAAGNWDTTSVPYIQNGVYTSALIDGKTASTASASIDGWALQVGAYNGATVTWKSLGKIQGDSTMWLTVDSTSSITINGWGGGNLGQSGKNLNYYVAANNGVTWSVDLASGTDQGLTMNYYLAGNGSVSYQALGIATHVIKQADVTLSGTSQVSSKTLVSFTSSSTTFTADAAIKVYDGTTLKETVAVTSVRSAGTAIVDTSSTLTTSDAVGTCELVQCTDGIVLYYVDGDPSAVVAKTYTPSISVNFTSGTALSTHADVGVGDYAIPGTSWNNLIGNNGTLSTVVKSDENGDTATVAGATVTISGTRGYWTRSGLAATSDLRQGYIDDADGNASPTVTVTGIPYYSYKLVVYFSNDTDGRQLGHLTVNGTNYKWDSTEGAIVTCEGTQSDVWGSTDSTAYTEGGNYLVFPTQVNTDGNLTIVGHRWSGTLRAGLAAVQIIEVPKTAEEGELVINVSGDTTYTVSENATYTTVYVTGTGTLAFDGEGIITTTTLNVGAGATVPMGSSITPTTVTGSGTVVYDGAQPSTTLGFDDSDNWFGTVWVKNVGDTSKGEATGAKVTTRLGSDAADATSNELNKWGNANSFVKFTNVRAFMAKADVPWTLVLEDDDTNYAWYNNEGWTAKTITIAGLKGNGTFWDINDGGCRPFLNFTDASQFTGTIKALGKQVFLNGAGTGNASDLLSGRIVVPADQMLTVASGKTWHTRNGLVVNGTLNVNGTLASDSTTAAVSGSGTVVFTGSAPSPTGDAWWKNSAWTGTVQMKSVTLVGTDLAFNDYGNTGSVLELNGCSGWLTPAYTCTVPLKIAGTLSLNNGYSNKSNAFKVGTLLGDGTISGSSSAPTMVFNVTTDWSGFTGKIALNNKCVVFGSTIPDTLAEGAIYIAEGAQVTVQNTADAAWWGVGGIKVDGELRANSLARFGGGTNITTSDNGVFTLTSTGNGSEGETETNYARIQGTGSLKYEGTGWRALTTNNLSTAVTLVNEQSGDILLSRALTYTIGSLSGSKKFQGNYGSGSRYLNIVQTKDTEWSGTIATDNSSRLAGFSLDATSTGTLTLSGTETQSATLAVNGGSVNLAGTWVGATTVAGTFGGTGTLTGDLTFSEGATFKAFAADDEDGLVVSGTVGYPAEGKVTVDVSAIEPEADVALIKAADLDANKFALADGTPEGYSLEVVDGVLTLKVPVTKVTITVPVVDNTVVTVTVGGETVSPKTEGGNVYSVAPSSVVTVTYTAAEGYRLPDGVQSVYNVTADEDTSVEVSEDLVSELLVAKVRNTASSQDDEYTTLAAAVAATKDGNHNPLVTLMADVDEAEVTVDSAIMLLGNYTISSDIKVVAGGQLQLMQVKLEGKLTIEENGIYVTGGGELSELVTKDGAKIQLTTLSDTEEPLSVTTLSVAGELTIISSWGLAVRDTYYKALSYVTANADIAEGATVDSVNEWSAKVEEEGDKTVVYLAITKVAVVDGVYYDTAQEAVDAAVASGEPAQFLVQPGTVTLGAGETLIVTGAFLPTVELEDGLTTPPYSLETTPYSEVTGLTIYTVLKEVSVVPASVVISYNTYAELSVIGYDEGATFGWTMYTNGVACSSMSGPVKISSGKTKATVKVYSETTAFDNVVAKVAITNGEDVIEREATITVADVAAKIGETVYTKAQLDNAIADAISSGEVLEHYLGVSTTISKGQTLKTKKLAERNGSASVKAAASTTAGEAWAIGKSAEDEDGVITWSVETETPIFEFTSEDGETVEYLAAPKNAAGTNKLLSDATIAKQFSVTKDGVVLDLNGHALTSTYASTSAGAVYVNVISPAPAALTVKDSVGGGSIAAASAHSVFMLGNNGQLTVEGGSFTGKHIVYGSKTTSVATITGGTFTATDAGFTLNMFDSARGTITVTGGTFTGFNPANNAAEGAGTNFVPNGYVSTETSTGVWTVAAVQEVPVEAGTQTEPVDSEAEAQADAAKVVPSVPAAVAAKLTEEQQTAYKKLFEATVVPVKVDNATKYAVEVALTTKAKADLQTAVDAEAKDLADAAVAAAADATNGGSATVTTTPGLYYVVEAGADIGAITPASCTLATGAETTLPVPNKGTSGFYKIRVSVTEVEVPATTPVEP